jgi:hypothetical protein
VVLKTPGYLPSGTGARVAIVLSSRSASPGTQLQSRSRSDGDNHYGKKWGKELSRQRLKASSHHQ